VPNNPSGLFLHGRSSLWMVYLNRISYEAKMQNIRFWSLMIFP
jgi:hypothetical protein